MSSGEVQQEEEEFVSHVTLQGSVESARAVINCVSLGLAPVLAIAMGLITRHHWRKGLLVVWERLRLPWGTGQHLKPLRMEYVDF